MLDTRNDCTKILSCGNCGWRIEDYEEGSYCRETKTTIKNMEKTLKNCPRSEQIHQFDDAV